MKNSDSKLAAIIVAAGLMFSTCVIAQLSPLTLSTLTAPFGQVRAR